MQLGRTLVLLFALLGFILFFAAPSDPEERDYDKRDTGD
jgi:hypothetical protein